jgi:hypothetical protein
MRFVCRRFPFRDLRLGAGCARGNVIVDNTKMVPVYLRSRLGALGRFVGQYSGCQKQKK